MLKRLEPKKSSDVESYSIRLDVDINKISISNNVSLIDVNLGTFDSFCINCSEKKCYHLGDINYELGELRGLPYNNYNKVCPVDSIVIKSDGVHIMDNCIGCGLCMLNCEIGAIVSDGYRFWVNKKVIEAAFDQKNMPISIESILNKTDTIQEDREIGYDFSKFNNQLESDVNTNSYENLLVRNYLFHMGFEVKVAAPGNNDNRIDFIGYKNSRYYVAEIKLNTSDYISLIRKILEDISVLSNKHNIPLRDITPIIIVSCLPNKRSDFYELLYDIKNILGIEISVIPFYFIQKIAFHNNDRFEEYILDFTIDNKSFFICKDDAASFLKEYDVNFGTEGYYRPLK